MLPVGIVCMPLSYAWGDANLIVYNSAVWAGSSGDSPGPGQPHQLQLYIQL